MRMSSLFAPTLREDPAEAETISHKLMLRAGMIRKVAAGIYNFLPLGYRVIKKIEQIIREEMDAKGGQELFMPALQPAELWKKSGRWDVYGPELMRLKDRNGREFCLGPTHEEIITTLVAENVKSYRELPLLLYQIQTKFRDEIRPRFGVMRAREFLMKDLYSFDRDEEGMNKSYEAMYDAYCRVFKRCGLVFKIVEADPGAIGGTGSHEFMVLAKTGEEEIIYCDDCNYAANTNQASSIVTDIDFSLGEEEKPLEKVHTPNAKSIEEVAAFLGVDKRRTIKTLFYEAIYSKDEWEIVAALIRGDYEVNETKLKNYLGCLHLNLAKEEEIAKVAPGKVGFVGPVNLRGVRIISDPTVQKIKNAVVGAGEEDYHFINANPGRDFNLGEVVDIRLAKAGDRCVRCGAELKVTRGIEVGHIFKLGHKYSKAMEAKFVDSDGKEKYYYMGCYGIGVGRTMAAAIEQNHDEDGIVWPMSIAPYHVIVIPVEYSNGEQMRVATEIYDELKKRGVEVVLDDRDERPGVKFKDADLIGFPLRVTVGEALKDGKVELRWRKTKETKLYPIERIVDVVVSEIEKELKP
ncbi:MAG: proline--tRNA ligase [Synergistetes bacterium]|nr:MAG: Proline--tRNA ligase [bacterium 42_11]MBC7332240.1 proline--tRNA ligase [Synergistota bacterium]MDK2871308.1 prolyl-tRNA synthetase [bacterium]